MPGAFSFVLGPRTIDNVKMGYIFEELIRTLSENAEAGDHYTGRDIIRLKDYDDMKALGAFSGKMKVPHDDMEHTEAGLNGFPAARTREMFDRPGNRLLLAANRYQTGFDQAKRCVMYALQKLKGVNAVRTLSRLNRIRPLRQEDVCWIS